MAQTDKTSEEILDMIADDIQQKQWISALSQLIKILPRERSPRACMLFVECIKHIKDIAAAPSIRAEIILLISEILADAFSHGWARPSELATSGIRFLYLGPFQDISSINNFDYDFLEKISDSKLLLQMLISDPICDEQIEGILTRLRQHLLFVATDKFKEDIIPPQHLNLYCALAQQCFINEYIYADSHSECENIKKLHASIKASLHTKKPTNPLELIAMAAYAPLHEIEGIDQLNLCAGLEPIQSLLNQQLIEPLDEKKQLGQITTITQITDDVSRMVESHYQENPYPRWGKVSNVEPYSSLNDYFAKRPHLAKYTPSPPSSTNDILIAGCGTGQHSIETALRFPNANVLAIDLSNTSLAYAMRMSNSLALHNLKYAKADILMLPFTKLRFDHIESVGVLHHLADPDKGWRSLLACLQPGGVMRIGLYSKYARREITKIHSHIMDKGYNATPDGIHRLRQDIKQLPASNSLKSVMKFSDFYSTSGCRDLLFHEYETCYNLLQIQSWIEVLGLNFIGFHAPHDLLELYHQEYPEDKDGINLSQWDSFEQRHPDSFVSMYQFWVQKNY